MNSITEANAIRRKKIIKLTVCVIAIAAIAACVLMWNSNRKDRYNKALDAFSQKNYTEAISLFEELKGYQDSEEKLQESHYQLGASYLASRDYDNAKSEFDQAGDYSDAYTQASESVYLRATAYLKAGNYDEATWDFNSISGYRDAATMAEESQYRKAGSLVEAGQYDAAYDVYASLTGYRDVDSILANDVYMRREASYQGLGSCLQFFARASASEVEEFLANDDAVQGDFFDNINEEWIQENKITVKKDAGIVVFARPDAVDLGHGPAAIRDFRFFDLSGEFRFSISIDQALDYSKPKTIARDLNREIEQTGKDSWGYYGNVKHFACDTCLVTFEGPSSSGSTNYPDIKSTIDKYEQLNWDIVFID